MQLKITTDYAIRTILYLAQTKRITTSGEIADAMCIPREYLINIIRDMRESGLVRTFPGAKGGYLLAKQPEDISLYDVIIAMERTIKLNRCLEHDAFCSRDAAAYCMVHSIYEDLQEDMERLLKGHTIADIIRGARMQRVSDRQTGE